MQRFGLRLLPDLYQANNPMPYPAAVDMEIELGIGLRGVGFGRSEERRRPCVMWALAASLLTSWPVSWFKRA